MPAADPAGKIEPVGALVLAQEHCSRAPFHREPIFELARKTDGHQGRDALRRGRARLQQHIRNDRFAPNGCTPVIRRQAMAGAEGDPGEL